MPLSPGTRVGAYEVIGPLGAGGMGEVYRARDTKLDREVALKILPPEFAGDAERVARFRREAKTLASINHPHIAQVHGLEEAADGALALVMELVEGENLAERLKRGAIPADEALPIARQIAEALEAAHEQGIVHRDLKPANIKLRSDGTVKVLDFGLAKAMEKGLGIGDRGIGTADSPTITSPAMTMRGVILGTAAYMAPEQAKGKPVDRRADTWAFGCVLFEMIAGSRPFDGEDTTEILGSIVKTEPEWSKLPASTPDAVVTLLRRCLKKDVRMRQQHIGDARVSIAEIIDGPIARVAPSSSPTPWVPWSVAGVMAVVALAAVMIGWPSRRPAAGPGPQMLELLLPDGVELPSGLSHSLAISRDGQQVAIVGMSRGTRRLYLRGAEADHARELPGTEGAIACGFSPDGKSLFLIANTGVLSTVSVADGLVTRVATGADVLNGGVWTTSGHIVHARAGGLWRVPESGGTPEQLTTMDTQAGEERSRP